MKPKVLLLTASYGSGHVMAANALIEEFVKKDIRPEVIDLVLQGGHQERMVASFYALLMRRGHAVWKLYREKVMPIKKGEAIRKIFELLHQTKFSKEIESINPDIIISTMDTASVIASIYKKSHPEVHVYTVVTDYVAHPLWAWQNMDGYFVGSDLVREFLIQHGVNKDKIHISGIPLRKQFQTKIKKDEVRQKLEIPLDHKVVLIAAGTYKSVPVEKIIESLSSQIYAFAIILAGKKEENVVEYAGILKEYGVIGKVISYTDNMQDYMIASDLYVSKAGGLTVAECLALGLPALYLNNFPGHEVGNAEYAQSLGAAINLSQISDLKPTLIELLSDSQKLDRMSKNASKAAATDASSDIVSMVLKTQN